MDTPTAHGRTRPQGIQHVPGSAKWVPLYPFESFQHLEGHVLFSKVRTTSGPAYLNLETAKLGFADFGNQE